MSKSTKTFALGLAVGIVAYHLYAQGATLGGEK